MGRGWGKKKPCRAGEKIPSFGLALPHCHPYMGDMNETIELDHYIEGLEEVSNLPRDILEALNRENEGSKPNIEETEVINLAEEAEEGKPVKIGLNFPKNTRDEVITLLKEFKEIFAWSYQDMPRLDIEIVVHRILVKLECLFSAVGPPKDEI